MMTSFVQKKILANRAICDGEVKSLHVWCIDKDGCVSGTPFSEEIASTVYLDGNIIVGNLKMCEKVHLEALSAILTKDITDYKSVISYMKEKQLDYNHADRGAIVEIVPLPSKQRLRIVLG